MSALEVVIPVKSSISGFSLLQLCNDNKLTKAKEACELSEDKHKVYNIFKLHNTP